LKSFHKTWFIGIPAFIIDRAAKLWAGKALQGNGTLIALPRLLELRYTENRGIALGFLSGEIAATLLLPLIAAAVWFLVFRRYRPTPFTAAASSLILGGFAGNFLDRLLYGYVVDMLFFPFLPWFICNVADVAISLGVGMVGFSLLFRARDWSEKRAKVNG